MAINICNINKYNKLETIRCGCEQIVDYLFVNNENLWKLLYYGDKYALSKANLSQSEKANLICTQPELDNELINKNILFQTQVNEALTVATNQIRIELGRFVPIDYTRGAIEINIQVVVPIKQKLIQSDYSKYDDRSVAITQELIKSLNGTKLECFCSPMYMNRQGDNGGRTGAERQFYNKDYCGYWLTFCALC